MKSGNKNHHFGRAGGSVRDRTDSPPESSTRRKKKRLSVSGSGVAGSRIGTQSNNGLGSATELVSLSGGEISSADDPQATKLTYINSGLSQNRFQITRTNVTTCPNGGAVPVANATAQFANDPTFTAFNNLAKKGPADEFDVGLPFFFGRGKGTIRGYERGRRNWQEQTMQRCR